MENRGRHHNVAIASFCSNSNLFFFVTFYVRVCDLPVTHGRVLFCAVLKFVLLI